jgi:heme-degrading monooxygenase HmoA
MIARAWHGRVLAEKGDAYLEFLRRRAIPDYRATPGNRGVYVLRRVEGGEAHFLVISFWGTREEIRAFAGDDVERARYFPEDSDFLLEFEPRVDHYDVAASPEPA